MTAFACQVVASLVLGEGNALFDKPIYSMSAILNDKSRRFFIIQPSAGDQRVLNMCFY